MTTLRKAAQQVVDEYEAGFVGLSLDKAVDALRVALAEPSQEPVQEPVAWMHPDDGRVIPAATMKIAVQDGGASLSSVRGYTIPLGPLRQPLTDEELDDMFGTNGKDSKVFKHVARLIETVHGIG